MAEFRREAGGGNIQHPATKAPPCSADGELGWLCGAKLPAPLLERLEEFANDDAACAAVGIEYTTQQCQDLLKNGAPGIHFYTLNKAAATTAIVKNLGLA